MFIDVILLNWSQECSSSFIYPLVDLINRSARAERYFECVKTNRNEHDHKLILIWQCGCVDMKFTKCLWGLSFIHNWSVCQNLDMCAVKWYWLFSHEQIEGNQGFVHGQIQAYRWGFGSWTDWGLSVRVWFMAKLRCISEGLVHGQIEAYRWRFGSWTGWGLSVTVSFIDRLRRGSKHIEGSKERYLLGQDKSSKLSG